jgi:HK97 family phage major capsid protein
VSDSTRTTAWYRRVIGYLNGRPIYGIAGGDRNAAVVEETLEQRRERILAQLDDPNFTGDEQALLAEAAEVRAEIEARNARTAERAQLLGATLTRPSAPAPAGGQSGGQVVGADSPEVRAQVRTAGERFAESPEFTEFRAGGYNGKVGVELEWRAVIDNTGTSGGAFQNPSRPADIPQTNADRMPRILDLLDRRTTDSNTVEYVRETTAAGTTAAETAEAGAKPESTFTFEVVTEPVRTIAHWTNITRQTLDDNAQLRGYIDGRLRYGLEFRADQQALNGNGTAPNLRGLLNVSGINTYAPGAAEARVISIRKGITMVQQDEYNATGVALNPADWELVELSTDDQGAFRVSPNVANALAPRIWGLNVVPTTVIAAGTGLVGDYRYGATWWERTGVQVFLSDSHASNFTSNILTLLAEMRAALSVWRPSAFCRITFNGIT